MIRSMVKGSFSFLTALSMWRNGRTVSRSVEFALLIPCMGRVRTLKMLRVWSKHDR